MDTILDWIFEGIANWIASIVTSVMDAISAIFLGALGTDMTAMEEYFPFVTSAFVILQYAAWALLFIITVWQLFRAFGGPITEAENPWHLLARSAIFAVLIGFAKPIFGIALDIARAPYTALMDSAMNPGDFTFAGIENVISSGLVTLVSAISVVGLLLQIILMIALGWNYFKLLLEVVERYVVVGVLCYTSPLAFSLGGSKATNKVFQSWCRMIGSQLLLLVMNVWFLRAFNSSVGQFAANGGALTSGQGNIFLWLFCALAFLKTAQKFDSYLASLGLSVAQTGSGMGMELMMGLRMLSGFAGGGSKSAGSVFGGSSAGSSAAGGASTASGAGGFAAGLASKFKGNSYVRDAVVDGGSRMGAGGGLGFVARTFGGMAVRGGSELTGASIASVASRPAAVSGEMPHGSASGADYDAGSGGLSEAAAAYNRAQFQQFMPGFTQQVSQIDSSRGADGIIEARHTDGSATAFYDKTMYRSPRGDHQTFEDNRGNQWYAIPGTPTVERRPVYENGKPVYDGDMLRTVNVESVKYKTTPTKFEPPQKRDVNDRKPPRSKKK
ncbi:MAG: hypothetical protein LBT36_04050 [Oscillospiraceae bacterium]|nr:hypothetical protein [Oscillospiraceae bacterium]